MSSREPPFPIIMKNQSSENDTMCQFSPDKLKAVNAGAVNVLMVVLSVFTASCMHEWMKNVVMNGIEFERIRYSRNESDTISIIGYMKHDHVIQGYPCKKGWIHFTKHKELKLFCLSESCEVENVLLPAGCWIINARRSDVTTVVFPDDTIIQGFPVRGGGGAKGARTGFYKSGKLRNFFPYKDFVRNGEKFRKSIFNFVQITSDGKCSQVE